MVGLGHVVKEVPDFGTEVVSEFENVGMGF
jgi:hypothetical protein